MKKIRIKRIELLGFYGQDRTVDFGETSTILSGRNGSGKTTVLNAINWCLLGEDLYGRTNHMLFDQTKEMTPSQAQTAKVILTLTVNDVYDIEFARQAKQKYEKKRGAMVMEKASSDEYRFYIDGNEVAAQKYKEVLSQHICSAKYMKFIINPFAWETTPWRDLRSLFTGMASEISPDEYTEDYSDIVAQINILGDSESVRKAITKEIGSNESEITKFENEVDTLTSTLPDLTLNEDASKIQQALQSELAELEAKIADRANSSKDAAEARLEIERNIVAAERAYQAASETYQQGIQRQISETLEEQSKAELQDKLNKQLKETLPNQIRLLETNISEKKSQREKLLAEYESKKKYQVSDICPTCGSKLSGKALTELKQQSSKRILLEMDDIVAQGNTVKQQIRMFTEQKANLEKQLAEATKSTIDINLFAMRLKVLKEKYNSFQTSVEGLSMAGKIHTLRNQLADFREDTTLTELQVRKGEVLVALERLKKSDALFTIHQQISEKIATAKSKLSEAQAKLYNSCKKKERLRQWEHEFAKLLNEHINAMFPERSRISTSKFAKNGDLSFDVCDVKINDRNAKATNTADRINAGVDVSTVIMRYCDIEFPLIVDGMESIHDMETYGRQLIATVVDESQPEVVVTTK